MVVWNAMDQRRMRTPEHPWAVFCVPSNHGPWLSCCDLALPGDVQRAPVPGGLSLGRLERLFYNLQ